MKKSTLITTIAMIVVVVVALSTATYAWFTSGTATQVTDTISTDAASGWYLYGASFGTPSNQQATLGQRSVTYSATAPLALHMLNTGLFSPAGALSTTLTVSDMTGTYTDTPFFSAEQLGFGIVSSAEVKTAESYQHQNPGSDPATYSENLNAIRIVNNNETDSDCHLTILVNLGASADTTAYVAGKKFRTFVVTDRATDNVFNTEYYYGSTTGSTATIHSTTAEAASTGACALVYSKDASNRDISNTANPTYGYSVAVTGDKFGNTALTAGDKYYTIDINLGQVAKYTAINLVFYAWFDGWALDNTAAGANISVVYSVGGTATAVAQAGSGN